MVLFSRIDYSQYSGWVEESSFSAGSVKECHAMVHVSSCGETFAKQLERLLQVLSSYQQSHAGMLVVMRRFFLSDISNQKDLLLQALKERNLEKGALSVIGQPPLDGSKIALWIYSQDGTRVYSSDNQTITRHGDIEHVWNTCYLSSLKDSSNQTREILETIESHLEQYGAKLADNCLRTWFYIRDVDTNYKGMVQARCSNFLEQGLNAKTHYIASTGIGGQPLERESLVQVDLYSAKGLKPEQVSYLYALDNLNPTYEYGVTFERGTAVQYGNRRHLIISGTASIDNHGRVVHVGDIVKQAGRMIENVEALLKEGNATLGDIAHIIVYLRDIADYSVVSEIMKKRFPETPLVFTLAPVCRPEWLIEMECMAVTDEADSRFADF